MESSCPSDNTVDVDQSSFWGAGNLNWDEHRIGWAIAGGCTVLTVLISMTSVLRHCRNYTKPSEQRQILRILYMPPVYAIISFSSYRFFRTYSYYVLIEVVYEAITLSAFLLLLVEFVAATCTGRDVTKAIERKEKRDLPNPFCCWRYRPTKPYFMYTLKWSVLQYVIIRPAVSIAGIICQVHNLLCESTLFSLYFANIYLETLNFASVSVASYGLSLFLDLTKEELLGRRPRAKFLSIKLIMMFTFYQSCVFSVLENRVIKPTEFWTVDNIVDGLNALAICIEMVFFSVLMMWAYTVNEYKVAEDKKTSIWRPLWDSVNYWDFISELGGSFKFFFNRACGTSSIHPSRKIDFAQAFGVGGRSMAGDDELPTKESIRLAPYPFSDTHNAAATSPMLS
ncbi:organic solute transporter Ostalpha-domain-containing protein [Suillus subaureus]|uniref:Organic solute transporter Ostalpha-domain-containing protein n=1 Tax=Suillus subaureus TaxID=48587 RepID=A0A9P7E855_9AGAM|nr:organic solute transporter Ostalpha-domain-containing protein [Suillus subaureus]KAG1814227.1 organic solute transporter Ostalpha-domain-containing protein [Suillus subaureus]